ncbi:putative membrane protein [Geomicrobium halophilum]|uniref:Putative membrane protein n=1 Tax=Geomicrobium halophilum TaxID=549000 RepID=A0A841PW87_9BACL|nr:hypothetical protein [Geomicrobium halophilum]MBB6451546.1 putative membrane protein [Geomicrobium halophilum]
MILFLLFWAIVIASIYLTFKRKQALYLGIPLVAMGAYMLIAILQVPLPFWDTVQLIYGLK